MVGWGTATVTVTGYRYSGTWELGTPKGLWKTVLNSELLLFPRFISVYWIGLGTEVAVLNSQVVPISQVVVKTTRRQVSLYMVGWGLQLSPSPVTDTSLVREGQGLHLSPSSVTDRWQWGPSLTPTTTPLKNFVNFVRSYKKDEPRGWTHLLLVYYYPMIHVVLICHEGVCGQAGFSAVPAAFLVPIRVSMLFRVNNSPSNFQVFQVKLLLPLTVLFTWTCFQKTLGSPLAFRGNEIL